MTMAKLITERQRAMIDRGYVWGLYRLLDHGGVERGTVVSLHRTDAAAQRAAKRRGAVGIANLSSEIDCGDYVEVAA
jgi:hypothetical protein